MVSFNLFQASADRSRWSKAGRVPLTPHALPEGADPLQDLRTGVGSQEGRLNYYDYGQVRDFIAMICVGTEQWHFSQTNVDPAAQRN